MPGFIVRILDADGNIIGIRLIRANSLVEAQNQVNQTLEAGQNAEVNRRSANLDTEGDLESVIRQLQQQGFFGGNTVSAQQLLSTGAVATTGGTGEDDPGAIPVPPPSESTGQRVQDFFSEAQQPFASFRRGLGRAGLDVEGTFRNALGNLFAPARSGAQVEGLFNPEPFVGDDPGRAFERSVEAQAGRSGGRAGIQASAASAFDTVVDALRRSAAGQPLSEEQSFFVNQLASGAGVLPGATPQEERSSQIGLDLARSAAGRRFSPFVAQSLLPSDDVLRQRFQRGGQQGGFFQDVRRGLGVA